MTKTFNPSKLPEFTNDLCNLTNGLVSLATVMKYPVATESINTLRTNCVDYLIAAVTEVDRLNKVVAALDKSNSRVNYHNTRLNDHLDALHECIDDAKSIIYNFTQFETP